MSKGKSLVHEKLLRPLTTEVDWKVQWRLWGRIKDSTRVKVKYHQRKAGGMLSLSESLRRIANGRALALVFVFDN